MDKVYLPESEYVEYHFSSEYFNVSAMNKLFSYLDRLGINHSDLSKGIIGVRGSLTPSNREYLESLLADSFKHSSYGNDKFLRFLDSYSYHFEQRTLKLESYLNPHDDIEKILLNQLSSILTTDFDLVYDLKEENWYGIEELREYEEKKFDEFMKFPNSYNSSRIFQLNLRVLDE